MSILTFLLGDDEHSTDHRETVAAIADAIAAMPERAPLGAALHHLVQKPGSPGHTWLVLLRVPTAVTDHPGGALRLRVEDTVTAALGRPVITTELPPGTDLVTATKEALDVYDSARGWIVPATT